MRTLALTLCLSLSACGNRTDPPALPGPEPAPPTGLLEAQTVRLPQEPGVAPEVAQRLLLAATETDRRYNIYGQATLATRQQTGVVQVGRSLQLAIPLRAGRCHRVVFAAEPPGIHLSFTHQSNAEGTSGALGQYRSICPSTTSVERLVITTQSPAPVAFALLQTESH